VQEPAGGDEKKRAADERIRQYADLDSVGPATDTA